MEITELPFAYPGKIYRSAMPYSAYDPRGELFQAFQDNDVSLVVLLSSDQECLWSSGRNLRSLYQEASMQVFYLPISDFSVPRVEEIQESLPKILAHLQEGGNVVVHCHAGIGRSGMVAACLAKYGLGYSSEEAIRWVREYIPGAIEMPEQEQFVLKA
jgi:protein-tyrosine phosphatase